MVSQLEISSVHHDGSGVFENLPSPITATRYHSLAVTLPNEGPIIKNAHVLDGDIMGLRHISRPIHGVQFHPESIASQFGYHILANFMRLAKLPINTDIIEQK